MKALLTAVALSAASLVAPIEANAATYTYVGSWEVDDGPYWSPVPTAYSGTEAAAMLFGGDAADYVISTISALVSDINFMAWVSTWGGACGGTYPCGTEVAQDYSVTTGGLYATPGDTSAFVSDWAIGSQYTNYAFVVSSVPVPAAGILLMGALGGLAAVRRRKTLA